MTPRNVARRAWARVAAALCLAPVVFAPVVVLGQDAPLPSGRTVVERHVAAIGGAAAFRGIESIRVRGRFVINGREVSAEFEQLAARPNRLRVRAEIAGVGRTEQGYDGTIAWMIDPQGGARLLTDRERAEVVADADFDGPLHLPDRVASLTTLGRVTFDGRPAYRVKVVLASGVEQDEYFDVESGLQLGWEAQRATPLGIVPTTAFLRDYAKFGPLLQPRTLVQKALHVEQVLRVTSVEYNVVSDAAFDAPQEIQALAR
jgi:hypothetical protein